MTVRITRDHNLSVLDQVGRLTGGKPLKQDPEVRKFRGLVVTTYALIKSGLSEKEFGKKYADREVQGKSVRRSNLERLWFAGTVAPSPRKVEAMNADIPGVSELDGHSVFPLLQNIPLTLKFITKQLARYAQGTDPRYAAWRFADEEERFANKTVVPIITRDDVINLVHRCDLDGFAVILGLVREAEVLQSTQLHMYRMHHLYRAAAATLEIPWFRPHADLLKAAIDRVHVRDYLSVGFLKPNWGRIEALSEPEFSRYRSGPNQSRQLWRMLESENRDVVEMAEPRFKSL